MQRLLADAEALTGVHYDINNLADVYNAIHAIQQETGISGATAAEAATTFSGSFNQMRAAATNFLGTLSTGEGVDEALDALIDSAETFLIDNALPMIGRVTISLAKSIIMNFPDIVRAVLAGMDEVTASLQKKAAEIIPNIVNKIKAKIKSYFPIKLGNIFSGIKLPHFNISGGKIPWGIGGVGVKPSISVDWYAKGGIFNNPSIIGVGEAGPEAVLPIDKLGRMIRENSGGTVLNVTMTVNGSDNPEAWAERFSREMKRQVRMGVI